VKTGRYSDHLNGIGRGVDAPERWASDAAACWPQMVNDNGDDRGEWWRVAA